MTACSDLQSAGSTVVGQPFTPIHNSTLRFQFEPTTTRLLDRDGLFQALPGLQPSNQDQSKSHMRQVNLKTFRGLGACSGRLLQANSQCLFITARCAARFRSLMRK